MFAMQTVLHWLCILTTVMLCVMYSVVCIVQSKFGNLFKFNQVLENSFVQVIRDSEHFKVLQLLLTETFYDIKLC